MICKSELEEDVSIDDTNLNHRLNTKLGQNKSGAKGRRHLMTENVKLKTKSMGAIFKSAHIINKEEGHNFETK